MALALPRIIIVQVILHRTATAFFSGKIAETATNVQAVEGGEARLPCNLSSGQGDAAMFVLWFRQGVNKPFARFDLGAAHDRREIMSTLSGDSYSRRMTLSLRSSPPALVWHNAHVEDNATYLCKVDFHSSPTRYSLVHLRIIEPPNTPVILDDDGNSLKGNVYHLEQKLVLRCAVHGGDPAPEVSWWKGRRLIDNTSEVMNGTLVVNRVEFSSLRRADQNAEIECRASNTDIVSPKRTVINIYMHLPPTHIYLDTPKYPLRIGQSVSIRCVCEGSEPDPTFAWFIEDSPISEDLYQVSRHGHHNASSILLYKPTIEDDNRTISCRATNDKLPDALSSAKVANYTVSVLYPPSVEIRLGKHISREGIKVGSDVYFECPVRANPRPSIIEWFHNGKPIVNSQSARDHLNLPNVTRAAAGNYSCAAKNSEGRGMSAPFILEIQFSPVCKMGQRLEYGVTKGETRQITCEVEAEPRPLRFYWQYNNSASGSIKDLTTARRAGSPWVSVLNYTPETDFGTSGTILCHARNAVGLQSTPCVFTIMEAGPPDKPVNCNVTNHTSTLLHVECEPGSDGGIPDPVYFLKIYDTAPTTTTGSGQGRAGETSWSSLDLDPNLLLYTYNRTDRPEFKIDGKLPLPEGRTYVIEIYGTNKIGSSESVKIPSDTAKTLEKKQGFPGDDVHIMSKSLPVLGVLAILVALVILSAVTWLLRRRSEQGISGEIDGGPKSELSEKPPEMSMRQDDQEYCQLKPTNNQPGDKSSAYPDVIKNSVLAEGAEEEKDFMAHGTAVEGPSRLPAMKYAESSPGRLSSPPEAEARRQQRIGSRILEETDETEDPDEFVSLPIPGRQLESDELSHSRFSPSPHYQAACIKYVKDGPRSHYRRIDFHNEPSRGAFSPISPAAPIGDSLASTWMSPVEDRRSPSSSRGGSSYLPLRTAAAYGLQRSNVASMVDQRGSAIAFVPKPTIASNGGVSCLTRFPSQESVV